MADENVKVVKTIIVLRSDSEQEFESVKDTLKLRKGEMAITIPDDKTQPCSGKIGVDGETPWGDLPYSFGPKSTGWGNGGGTVIDQIMGDNKTIQIKDNVASIIGADDPDNVGKSFRINDTGDAIEWFISATKEETQANKTLIDQINDSLANNYYDKTQTDALVSKVFKFMGTKTSKAELDAILSTSNVGDVWAVKGAGDTEANLYVCVENEAGEKYWEDFPLAVTVDMSNYVLTTDFNPVKITVESLPKTLFSRISAATNSTGISISAITSTQGSDGRYTQDSVQKVVDIKPVVAGSSIPGLMTGADKAKLDSLSTGGGGTGGGDVNVLESVMVDNVALPIDANKAVNIPVAGENLGVVKNYAEGAGTDVPNKVIVNADGTMTVPEINIETLVQNSDTDFIISGGSAAG